MNPSNSQYPLEADLERVAEEFYNRFNQIKDEVCSSLRPISPFLYCMNDKAKDKPQGAIKKLGGNIYCCCGMNQEKQTYDTSKIDLCPYKTEPKKD